MVQKAFAFAILILLLSSTLRAQSLANSAVANTTHNLSANGPGTVKAATETEICIFCHTPHNATPVRPLWNRALPTTSYRTYTSNSLKAQPGQPTGDSKLCLSCHDGTIALGSVNSRSQPITMAGGIINLPTGKTNLGTDLSGDHPISFPYDSTLANANPKLKSPNLLPNNVRLDANNELQCTTCHDAHNNQFGKFLVMSNTNSELCNSCHAMAIAGTNTDITQHSTCDSCHQSHTAPSSPYLLTQAKVTDTCLNCHGGNPGTPLINQGPNIAATLTAGHAHDNKPAVNLSNHIPDNTTCADCHESHTMKKPGASVNAPGIQTTLGKIDGINIAGAPTNAAQYEYEVCFKCHADNATTTVATISRQISQPNLRIAFAGNAISFHPVAVQGKNLNVPSLRPGYTTSSMMQCTDCHGSDASKKAGGIGPNGPHGSAFPGLLLARYETADFTPYSTGAYALCFNCHDNTKIVADTGPFPWHNTHINTAQTPCATCHDSHGIPSAQGTTTKNFALINFNTSICQPDAITGKLEFNHTADNHGSCYVNCHNKNHSGTTY